MEFTYEEKYSKIAQKKDEGMTGQQSPSTKPALIAKELSSHNVNDIPDPQSRSKRTFSDIMGVDSCTVSEFHRDIVGVMDQPTVLDDIFFHRPTYASYFTFLFDGPGCPRPFCLSPYSFSFPDLCHGNTARYFDPYRLETKFSHLRVNEATVHLAPLLPNLDFTSLKEILVCETLNSPRGLIDTNPATHDNFDGHIPILVYSDEFKETRSFYINPLAFYDGDVDLYGGINRAQAFSLCLFTFFYQIKDMSFTKNFFLNWQLIEFGNPHILEAYKNMCERFRTEISNIGNAHYETGALEFDPHANGFGEHKRLVQISGTRAGSRAVISAGLFLFLLRNTEACETTGLEKPEHFWFGSFAVLFSMVVFVLSKIPVVEAGSRGTSTATAITLIFLATFVDGAIPVPKFNHESHQPIPDPKQSSLLMTSMFFVLMIFSYLVVECPVGKKLCNTLDSFVTKYFERKARKSRLASTVLEAKKTLTEMYEEGELHVETDRFEPEGHFDVPIAKAVPIYKRAINAAHPVKEYMHSKISVSKIAILVLQMRIYTTGLYSNPKILAFSMIFLWLICEYFSDCDDFFFAPIYALFWKVWKLQQVFGERFVMLFDKSRPRAKMVMMYGEWEAEKTNEDAVSVSPTEFSGSTIESDVPIKKIKFSSVKDPDPDPIDFVKTFGGGVFGDDIFNAITGDNFLYDCVDLMRQIWMGPSVDERGRVQCALYYGCMVKNFVTKLLKMNRKQSVRAFDEILRSFQVMFGLEADGKDDEIPGWLETIQDSLSNMATLDKSPMHEGVTGFLSLLAITPIFFYDLKDSKTYIDAYKSSFNFLRKGGISIQAILSTMLKSSSAMYTASKTGNLTGVLKALIVPDLKTAKFIELSDLVRQTKAGTKRSSYDAITELCNRVRSLTQEYSKVVKSGRSKTLDETRYTECLKMQSTMHLIVKSLGSKKEPTSVSLRGPAGIGKSVLLNYLIKLNAKRENREDYLQIGKISLSDQYHTGVTSATSDIVFDDCNNLKAEHRKKTIEEAYLEAVNTDCKAMIKADLPDKGAHFFLNDATWSCENQYPEPTATLEPGSYYRRLGFSFDMKIKPEYACPQGKVRKGIPIPPGGQHCLYRRWQYRDTGNRVWEIQPIGEWMEIRELLVEMFKYMDEHNQHEKDMLRKRLKKTKTKMCACNIMTSDICDCPLNTEKKLDELDAMTAKEPDDSDSEDEVSVLSEDSEDCLSDASAEARLMEHAWFGDVTPTKPTVTQGAASWMYLQMMGDGWTSSFVSFVWRHQLIEAIALVLILCGIIILFLSEEVAEVYAGFVTFVFGSLVLHLSRKLRNSLTRVLSLSPVSALSMFGDFLSQKGSYFTDADRLKKALLLMAGGLVTKYAMKMAAEYFLPIARKAIKPKKEPTIADVLQGATAESEETAEAVTLDKVQKVEQKRENIWVEPVRVRPSGHHCAKTISAVDMEAKVLRNTFVMDYGAGRTILTMLNSCVGMTVVHAFVEKGDLVERELEITDHMRNGKIVKVKASFDTMALVKNKDAVLIYMPNHDLGLLPDLIRFFPTTRGYGTCYVNQVTRRLDDSKPQCLTMEAEWLTEKLAYTVNGMSLIAQDLIKTQASFGTAPGLCGTLYHFNASPRCIAGIHIAGNKTTFGVVAMLSRSDIEAAEDKLRVNFGYVRPVEFTQFSGNVLGFHQKIEDKTESRHPSNFFTEGRIETLGSIPVRRSPSSDLRLNPNWGAARKCLGLKNTKLKPLMRMRRTYHKVIRKSTEEMPVVDNVMLMKATDMYADDICALVDSTKKKYPNLPLNRPLTWEETLNGIEDTPLCRTKMAGSGGGPGYMPKSFYYNEDEEGNLTMKAETQLSVELALERVKKGQNSGIVNEGCLKDEPVKPTKMYLARMFTVVGLTEYLLTSKVLRALMEIWRSNPAQSETAIGLNRVGPEWYDACEGFYSEEFVNNCFDSDFEEYDMTQSPQLKTTDPRVFSKVAKHCEWSDEDIDLLMKILVLPMVPLVNTGGTIVALYNLFMSGILQTALGNGIHSAVVLRYDFLRYQKSSGFKGNFKDHVKALTLGDDLKAACSNTLRKSGWHPEHLAETCSMFGLKLTNAEKTGPPGFKKAPEVEFLKSRLHYHEATGMNVSVVGPGSYLKSYHLFIQSKAITYEEYSADLGRQVLLESYWGGPDSYNEMRKRLLAYTKESNLPSFFELEMDYEARTAHELDKIGGFQNQPRLNDESNLGMKLIEDYDNIDDTLLDYAHMVSESEFFECDKEGLNNLLKEKKEIVEAAKEGITAESEAVAPTGEDIHNITQIDQAPTDAVTSDIKQQLLDDLPLDTRTKAEDILLRRQQMPSISWTGNLVGGEARGVELAPWLLMSQRKIIHSRLAHVAGYRADIVVTFEVSAPVTVAGSILAAVLHYPDFSAFGDEFKSPSPLQVNCARSQKQNIKIIAGNGDGVFKMTVPFIHTANFVHVSDQESLAYLPVIRLRCLTPLVSALDLTPSLNISVFMEFENLKTYGATSAEYPGVGQYQYFGARFGAEAEVNPVEKISDAATALSKGLAQISRIPGLGGLAMPANVVKQFGKIAHKHGFSKPMATGATEMAPGTISGMANIRGITPAKVISPDPAQNVSIGGVHVGIDTDELSIAWYTQRYSIVSAARFGTNQPAGEIIYSHNVTPAIFVGDGTGVVQPASCAVPAMYFNHWAGSMQYRITIIAPTNISGWLSMSWEPLIIPHAAKEAATKYINSTETILINVAETREWEFDVHWGSPLPALTTLGPIDQIDSQWADVNQGKTDLHNGAFLIQVHQPLITSVGLPVDLDLIVEARCHSNMKFFDYTGGQHISPLVTQEDPVLAGGASSAGNLENNGVGLASTCVSMPVCAETSITPFLAPPRDGPVTQLPTELPQTQQPVTAPTKTPSTMQPSLVETSSQPTAPLPSMRPSTVKTSARPSWLPSFLSSSKPSYEPSMTDPPTNNEPVGETAKPSSAPSRQLSAAPSKQPSRIPSSAPSTSQAPSEFSCEDRDCTERNLPASLLTDYGDSYLEYDHTGQWKKVFTGTQFGDYIFSAYTVGSLGKRRVRVGGVTNSSIENDAGPIQRDASGSFSLMVEQSGFCTGCEVIDNFYMDDETEPITINSVGGFLPRSLAYRWAPAWEETSLNYEFGPGASGPHTLNGKTGYMELALIEEKAAAIFLLHPWIVSVPLILIFSGNLDLQWTQGGTVRSGNYTSQFPEKFSNALLLVTGDMSDFSIVAHGGFLGYYMLTEVGGRRLNNAQAEGPDGPDEGKWFSFGQEQSTDDIPAILAGEHMESFRSLLKIAIPMAEYRLASGPGDMAVSSITNDLYSQEPVGKTLTLYSYLMRCYNARRGGLCFYYHLKGHGSVEFSRYYDGTPPETAGIGGTEVIDSRANPTGCVKFPYYSTFLFDYAFWAPTYTPSKHLCITAWDGPLAVKETMFPAEDFSFFNFRGAALVRIR